MIHTPPPVLTKKNFFFLSKVFIVSTFLSSFILLHPLQPEWGFWAHRRINRLAVYRLPPELIGFYKANIDYITENAVNPDRRRYAVVGEAERHFIDLDVYGDSATRVLPRTWSQAVKAVGEDSLRKHGIVPWQVQISAHQLTAAFRKQNVAQILRISADLGHYVADAHVPLHTTKNYNGQLTGQTGIHAFWESRIPELMAENYDLWLGSATYIDHPANAIWKAVAQAHIACDSVLKFEKELTRHWPDDKKYSYETRNNQLVRSYSTEYTKKYNQLIDGQVERQMKAAIKMVGDLWYTCWLNAGQPDLPVQSFSKNENTIKEEAAEQSTWLQRLFNVRNEPDE